MQVILFVFFFFHHFITCSVWKAKEVFFVRKADTKHVEKSTHCLQTAIELGALV